jgi:hypothetical protein
MAGYIRQSTFADGDTITSLLFNNEYNQLLAAFNNTTGHKHDGTAAEGPVISVLGDGGLTVPLNKILVDSVNDHLEFYTDVAGVSTQQFRIQDGAIVPITDNDIDLGTASLEFKDAYFDGTVTLDGLIVGSSTSITDIDIDLTTVSATDNTLASAKAIKTYVDAQVTVQDLDFSGDTGGSQAIDLDSQTLTLTGGTGIDTVGSAQTMTFAIDTAVVVDKTTAQTLTNKTLTTPIISSISNTGIITLPTSTDTLVGRATTDTLTNKTLTTPVISSISNTGTVTLPTATDTLVGRATTDTLTNKTINVDNNTVSNIEVDNLKAGVLDIDLISVAATDTTLASAKAIKTYVDAQVATANELEELTDVTVISKADANLLIYDSVSTDWENHSLSGDITITNTGVATIGTGAVTSGKILDGTIINADINVSAAIDATKLADGSVTNSELQYINTLSSNAQTQLTSLNTLKAPLASPALTGTPTAPTATSGDNSTQLATTAFVTDAVAVENELSELNDVTITSITDADFLVYDSVAVKWENQAISGAVTIDNAGVSTLASGVDATKIANGSVSDTEFQYLDGVTSAIQTQINTKQATIDAANRLNADLISDGSVSNTEFQYLDGVTSSIQTQINTKQATIDAASRLNADLVGDGSVDNTEFSYINGVTSSIQTQIDTRASNGFAIAMAIAL